MNENGEYIRENACLPIPPVDFQSQQLMSSIRKQYMEYISKLLAENYISWCGETPPPAILGATQEIELHAAARSMVVPLYKKAVLSMIKSIKLHTQNKDLFPIFRDFCIKYQTCDKLCQTDDVIIGNVMNMNKTSIHNNTCVNDIKEIPKTLNGSCEITKNSTSILNESDIVQDQVLKEMEELFKTNDVENCEDFIFGEISNNKQIMLIMEEIKQYGRNNSFDSNSPPQTNGSAENINAISPQQNENERLDAITLNQRLDHILCDNKSNRSIKKENETSTPYQYTKWPCEAYYQKKNLCEKLDEICERSFKLHGKVKSRFFELFGPESEDEQALQSPDISVDFARSCRQRIAPWIAKHLRPYFLRGAVSSHLFRPLAKHLIYQLINMNQYPDDYEVFLFVKEYFKHHRRIKCQADF